MNNLIHKDEAYQIIGICMEVHRELGYGFLEAVYKDALEFEFQRAGIPYRREHEFEVIYKSTILNKKYFADFTVFDKIILEAKAIQALPDELLTRCINYLKVSNYQLCLLVNFGAPRLEYKRIILSEEFIREGREKTRMDNTLRM